VRQTLHDAAILVARAGIGGIFFANGWEKLEAGLNATTEEFARIDAPLPYAWAAVTMLVELLGGAMLVAGFAVPVCGILLFAEAIAVFALAAGDPQRPLTGGSANLVIALCAASLLLAVVGAGRVSVDHMVVIKRRDPGDEAAPGPDAEADQVLTALRGPRGGSGDAPAGLPAGPGRADPAAGAGSAAAEPRSRTAEPGTPDDKGDAGDKGDAAEVTAPVRVRKGRQRRTEAASAEGPEKEGTAKETPAKEGGPGPKSTTAKGTTGKGDVLVAGRKENPSD
jgi:putative oxidoreductase